MVVDADELGDGVDVAGRAALRFGEGEYTSNIFLNYFEKDADLRRAKVEGGAIVLKSKCDGAILHANIWPATRPTILRASASRPAAPVAAPLGAPPITIHECAVDDPSILPNIAMLRRGSIMRLTHHVPGATD